MKKILPILMLLFILFSCKRESPDKNLKNTTLSHALADKPLTTLGTAVTTTTVIHWEDIPSDEAFAHSAPFSVSGVTIVSTNGAVYHQAGANAVTMFYDGSDNNRYGSGFAIQYPFKKGKSYKISMGTNQVTPAGNTYNLGAILEGQLTNNITQAAQLYSRTSPNVIFGNDKPKFDFNISQSPGTKSIEFTPDQCFEYLWLSLQSNGNNHYPQVVVVGNISIAETPILAINGPDLIEPNQPTVYVVQANGYTISDSFQWTVTGGLQIVGSSFGPTVSVSAPGDTGGNVIANIGGCLSMVTKTVAPNVLVKPIISGPTSILAGKSNGYTITNPSPNATSYTWTITGGGEIHPNGIYAGVIFEDIKTQKSVTITAIANGPKGSSPAGTLNVAVKACPTCAQ
ncbi:hypothetical protein SAMN05421821_105139 [Mucilaginibacter lappiensis]|uniref:PKD domain-containing protein n=1 Tax=Mucilaginibacter lappiensis TaxID=354630 RepID=A0ABR6PIY5_9SPHI|nr:hypothetical protein [Mucilaginibacter lappiensis]MBB6109722.1 hypothetical protein [Mucilaginibacter lappiensis]SIR13116.1 hypothetical protein SAMN05421821_105139 [Mucilaginibacter lappiensis]